MTTPTRSQEGAALLSVLLLVAVMAVVALAMTETTLRALERSTVADEKARVIWEISGAEEAGLVFVRELQTATNGTLTDQVPVLRDPIDFVLDSARISGTLRDATNCLDLNALALSGDGDGEQDEEGVLFQTLLTQVGIPDLQTEGMTDSLLDWIDPDQTPRLSGAEDSYYASLATPYLTPGQPLVEIAELRAISGFEKDAVDLIAPLICARPSEGGNESVMQLNINTLTLDQAPLLSIAFEGELGVQEARDVLSARPVGGWPSLEVFLALEAIDRIAPESRRLDFLGISSTHIAFTGTVFAGAVSGDFETLFELGGSEPVRIVRRQYGAR